VKVIAMTREMPNIFFKNFPLRLVRPVLSELSDQSLIQKDCLDADKGVLKQLLENPPICVGIKLIMKVHRRGSSFVGD
jgi:hypothetical protein